MYCIYEYKYNLSKIKETISQNQSQRKNKKALEMFQN